MGRHRYAPACRSGSFPFLERDAYGDVFHHYIHKKKAFCEPILELMSKFAFSFSLRMRYHVGAHKQAE
jgi:hypothetical protein